MKAGSLRNDCLAAFLVRWGAAVVGDFVCCCDDDEDDEDAAGLMGSGAPGSRPLAARAGITGVAACAARKSVSDSNLVAVLLMDPSSCDGCGTINRLCKPLSAGGIPRRSPDCENAPGLRPVRERSRSSLKSL
jgi:hypothetical protein